MPEYKNARILVNEEVIRDIFKMTIETKIDYKIKPGQFYMLKCWEAEPVLWRPISVSEVREDKLDFLYAVAGRGTEMLSKLKMGQELQVMGPLGNGFKTEDILGRVALVCGGIGIAPMVELSKKIKGTEVDLYAGFRSGIYAIDSIRPRVKKVHIATEDGSIGHKGYITEIFDAGKYDIVLCCGPEPMMVKVLEMCREAGTEVYVSMEKHMACGVGACLGCTCKTKVGNKRICKEGPVFKGSDLVI